MNTQDIRINNMHDIISCLRESNGMTKKDLAEATHLSFSTVSSFCNQLMECGVLYSRKGLSVTVGRMPEHLYIRYDSFLTVCLDLQRQGLMEFAVLNLNDEVLFCKRYDISLCNGIREIVQYAYSVFCQLCSDFPNSQYLGVGVSVSGIFDKASEKIIGSAIPSMDGVPVKAIIEEIFGMPCYVDNEANLCAIGTYATHAGEDDLVYMHISEGLGIGVYTGGKLLSGHNGYGGEIAHIPFGTLGRRCPACGCVNCVETELSIPWLLQNSVWKLPMPPLWISGRRWQKQSTAAIPLTMAFCMTRAFSSVYFFLCSLIFSTRCTSISAAISRIFLSAYGPRWSTASVPAAFGNVPLPEASLCATISSQSSATRIPMNT